MGSGWLIREKARVSSRSSVWWRWLCTAATERRVRQDGLRMEGMGRALLDRLLEMDIPISLQKDPPCSRWCCDFQWIKESRWGFFCTLEGCAGGRRYNWTAFCFLVFGTAYFYNITRCFNNELTPSGEC